MWEQHAASPRPRLLHSKGFLSISLVFFGASTNTPFWVKIKTRITPEPSQTVWAAIKIPSASGRRRPSTGVTAVVHQRVFCEGSWPLCCHLVAVYGCGLRLRTDAHVFLAAERVCPALAAATAVISQIRRCAGRVNSSSSSVQSFPRLRPTGSV